jgi:hypothetical protein
MREFKLPVPCGKLPLEVIDPPQGEALLARQINGRLVISVCLGRPPAFANPGPDQSRSKSLRDVWDFVDAMGIFRLYTSDVCKPSRSLVIGRSRFGRSPPSHHTAPRHSSHQGRAIGFHRAGPAGDITHIDPPKTVPPAGRATACYDAAPVLARLVGDGKVGRPGRDCMARNDASRAVVLLREAIDDSPELAEQVKSAPDVRALMSRPEFQSILNMLVKAAG